MGDIHPEERLPACLCDPLLGSQCCRPASQAALVSPGHGEAWVLGPTQEASLASDLRHRPQGQTISSLSLALQKSGLGAGGERAELGRGQGLQALCC